MKYQIPLQNKFLQSARSPGARCESRTGRVVLAALLTALVTLAPVLAQQRAAILITGLGGQPEFEENFTSWADTLESVLTSDAQLEFHRIDGTAQRRDAILALFDQIGQRLSADAEIWIFLIGHGSHDGHSYKFNIKGPDLTNGDLATFFELLGERRIYLVAATSASGALLEELEGSGRVVVTATRNARERQPPLFMSFFVEGAGSAEADTDKDGRISLEEIFRFSEQNVIAWYEEKGRIQTEHPQLNDAAGGNVLASSAYLSAPPERSYRTLEARELAGRRTTIEREIQALKLNKGELSETDYYQRLQDLLVQLAQVDSRIADLEGVS